MPDVLAAFLLKATIALTLPLGSVIARFWRSPEFVVGLMTAFGAGALIAGVAVDLVAVSLDEGTYLSLGLGAVVGGVAFTGLNALVNARGGFLRKASTTITYFKARELLHRRNQLRRLQRVSWFDDLPPDELDVVAELLVDREFPSGSHVHHSGDRTEHLTVLASGQVELLRSDGSRVTIVDDAFGTNAFLTGAPHTTTAIALEDTRTYQLPRRALFDRIEELPELRQRLAASLAEPDVAAYLTDFHGLSAVEVGEWLEAVATGSGGLGARIRDVDRPDLERLTTRLRGLHWTRGLDGEHLEVLADRLYVVRFEDGEVLYQRGDRGDRLFVVDEGEVLVVAPEHPRVAQRARPGDSFGTFAFATGARRMGTAIASGTASVWVMRRRDLDALLSTHPAIREAWTDHITSDATLAYLRRAHGMTDEVASSIVDEANRAATEGRAAPEMARAATITGGAAIAIWLGIALDGIPESLVVGASLATGIPFALVAGAVLSNIPEALASSRGMADNGIPWRRIFLMWGSLVLIAGTSSALGLVTLAGATEGTRAFVEGLAGGAIITVAAETMFPEAIERSGALTGLAALLGFLVAASLTALLG